MCFGSFFLVGWYLSELHEFRKDKICANNYPNWEEGILQFPIQLPIRGDFQSQFSYMPSLCHGPFQEACCRWKA